MEKEVNQEKAGNKTKKVIVTDKYGTASLIEGYTYKVKNGAIMLVKGKEINKKEADAK